MSENTPPNFVEAFLAEQLEFFRSYANLTTVDGRFDLIVSVKGNPNPHLQRYSENGEIRLNMSEAANGYVTIGKHSVMACPRFNRVAVDIEIPFKDIRSIVIEAAPGKMRVFPFGFLEGMFIGKDGPAAGAMYLTDMLAEMLDEEDKSPPTPEPTKPSHLSVVK